MKDKQVITHGKLGMLPGLMPNGWQVVTWALNTKTV